MLKKFNLGEVFFENVINFFIILYAAILPLGFALANIVLVIMSAFFLFYFVVNKSKWAIGSINDIKVLALFSALFFIYLFSLFYSNNFNEGIEQVYKKLPIFLLTIFVYFLRRKIKKNTIVIALNAYSSCVTFVCLMSLLLSVYNCYSYEPIALLHCLSGQNLASVFISYHKLYFSLYITIAIFFILFLIFNTSKRINFFKLKITQLLILFTTLMLLGGRNAIIVSILLLVGFYWFYCKRNKTMKSFIFFSLVLFSIFSASVFLNPILQNKFLEMFNTGNQFSITKRWGGFSVRKVIWECSWNVFEHNPLLGVGVGDVQESLNESYLIYAKTSALNVGTYNAHNDMLQILITTGVLGVIMYIISLICIFLFSFKKQNYVHCVFLILFMISGLTESLLERDMGIRVYSFFTILLFILNTHNNENSSDTQQI